ncbi:MAG: hypothetical protein ACI4QN_05145 [Candidatus Coproplasma sp.]
MSKKKKSYQYKIRLKRGVCIRLLKAFLKTFKSKPQFINESGGELESKAIYLSNHSGADGPLTYELYFPMIITGWGAHEMFGNYRERWNYLYHVFYRQKLHWGKLRSFFVVTVFGVISKRIYRGIGLIPTYTDGRFATSLKTSCKILDADSPLLIFPEDSSKGYFNPPYAFNQGFITMAKLYYKMRKIDLPVYSAYLLNEKKRKMVVGKPIYVNQLLEEGKSEDEICNMALENMQELYYKHSAEYAKQKALEKE